MRAGDVLVPGDLRPMAFLLLRSASAARFRAGLCVASLVTVAFVTVGASCAAAQSVPDANHVHEYGGYRFRLVPVAEGLENPWALAFLPNGDMLVTERAGRLRVVRDGVLAPEAVQGLPPIRVGGQGGLLDVVVHPEFASNQLVYISYSKPSADNETATTAIIRGRLQGSALVDVEEIFLADAWSTGRGHYGSRLAFDDEGMLFITIGDRQAPPSGNLEAHPAQDLSNHQGTVVRLHDDGRVPADNPFVNRAGARAEVWSYGHRSPQGLAIDPATGNIWQSEHGPQGGDELNVIRKGANYGWPVIGYGVNYGPARTPIHESASRQGMEQPAKYWVPSIATSGLMVYHGDRFPNWKGNLFLGGMNGNGSLSRLAMDGTTVVAEDMMLGTTLRVRDVRANAAGDIFLVLDDRGGAQTPVVRLEPVN